MKALAAELGCFKLDFGVAVGFEGGLALSFATSNFLEIEEMTANLEILDFEGFTGAVSGHFKVELQNPTM